MCDSEKVDDFFRLQCAVIDFIYQLTLYHVLCSFALLTLGVHAREGYSSHPVCLSVCYTLILEITDN